MNNFTIFWVLGLLAGLTIVWLYLKVRFSDRIFLDKMNDITILKPVRYSYENEECIGRQFVLRYSFSEFKVSEYSLDFKWRAYLPENAKVFRFWHEDTCLWQMDFSKFPKFLDFVWKMRILSFYKAAKIMANLSKNTGQVHIDQTKKLRRLQKKFYPNNRVEYSSRN